MANIFFNLTYLGVTDLAFASSAPPKTQVKNALNRLPGAAPLALPARTKICPGLPTLASAISPATTGTEGFGDFRSSKCSGKIGNPENMVELGKRLYAVREFVSFTSQVRSNECFNLTFWRLEVGPFGPTSYNHAG